MSDVYSNPYAQFLTPQAPPPQVPAPAVVPQIIAAEGTGQNPRSSANGVGQFINSTWLDMINKYRPDLAYGKTKDQILALRQDPKIAGPMVNAYAAENSEALSSAGLTPDAGSIKLAHFAGPQGAIGVLKANPNTPVSQILSADAIRANPQIANMTAGQLRQWVANGYKNPAEGYYGGALHVTVSPQSEQQNPYAQFVQGGSPQSISTPAALGEGVMTGLGMGWRDEAYAAAQASGLPEWLGGFRTLPGAARLAYEHSIGQPGEASQVYDQALQKIREYQSQAGEQHPVAFGTGEVVGTLAPLVAAPYEAGATLPVRALQAAKVGGVYGAISGAGEGTDLESRANGMIGGATIGALSGAVGEPVMGALGKAAHVAYDYTVKPAVSLARGFVNPTREAQRRVVGAISRDVQSGRAGLTPSEWMSARQAGEPVAIADLGGPTTQGLLRSAANTSPEAEGAIRDVIEPRYASQNERFADTVRGLVANGANSTKSRAQLEAEYDIEREPLYAKAYRDGSKGVWTPEMQRLAGAPSIQEAIRGAVAPMKDRDIVAGYKLPRSNPFQPNPLKNGAMELREDAKGNKVVPELAFWDQIVRNLNGRIGELMRSGNETRARDIIQLKNELVKELDTAFPSYAKARGTAAEFFKANDAIDAGAKAVSFKGDPIQVKVQMNKMGPAELELFKEGFANELAQRIEATGDRTNIINKVYNSPQSRKMIQTVFGEQGATRLEMRLRLENIMQAAKNALGNSTTAKQLLQSGLAGGAIGAYLEGHDFTSALTGFEHGAGIGAGIRIGGGKMVGIIDQRTAQKVGELLASNNPAELIKGLKIASSNNRIANAIRALDNRLAIMSGTKSGTALLPSGTVQSAAQTNEGQR